MLSSTGICLYIPVDANQVYICRCFLMFVSYPFSSTCICFSRGVPAILPYFANQSRFPGFHLPPAALACERIEMSAASIRRGTRLSAVYFGGGGVHSFFSTINSIVFSRCRNSASYLKRTHNRASPYFSTRVLVPRCPGLRIRRVFT